MVYLSTNQVAWTQYDMKLREAMEAKARDGGMFRGTIYVKKRLDSERMRGFRVSLRWKYDIQAAKSPRLAPTAHKIRD